MTSNQVLCSISTRGRYFTTLPLAISSVINQTRAPDKVIIFDDNDETQDMRQNPVYSSLYQMMDLKGIQWEWLYAQKKGQHYNHQMANTGGYDWVWRVDDDNIPEPNVLKTLLSYVGPDVGGVGGSVLFPSTLIPPSGATGAIDRINNEPNVQWSTISAVQDVDHLHCSFLYRAGVHDYNLGLSRVAHREETLFSWGLRQKGYRLLVVPEAVTWHLKNPDGGIRSHNTPELFHRDEEIFENFLRYRDHNIVVLNCGMGDHIVFRHVLPDIPNPLVFSCYPDIVPGGSIAEAQHRFGDIDQWNVYKKMDQWKWTHSLESAFRKLYLEQP